MSWDRGTLNDPNSNFQRRANPAPRVAIESFCMPTSTAVQTEGIQSEPAPCCRRGTFARAAVTSTRRRASRTRFRSRKSPIYTLQRHETFSRSDLLTVLIYSKTGLEADLCLPTPSQWV